MFLVIKQIAWLLPGIVNLPIVGTPTNQTEIPPMGMGPKGIFHGSM